MNQYVQKLTLETNKDIEAPKGQGFKLLYVLDMVAKKLTPVS